MFSVSLLTKLLFLGDIDFFVETFDPEISGKDFILFLKVF